MPINFLELLMRKQNNTGFLTPGINGEKPLPVKGPAQPAQPLPTIGGTRPTPAPISGDMNDIAAEMGQPLRMGANGAPVNTMQPTAPNVPAGLSEMNFGVSYDRPTTRVMETDPRGKQVLSGDGNATPFQPRTWDNSTPIAVARNEKVASDRMNRAAEKQGMKQGFSTETGSSPGWARFKRTLKDVGTGAVNGVRNGGGGNDQNVIGNLIGGAIAGGATSIFAPERAAEMRFETWDAPKMRHDEAEGYAKKVRDAELEREQTAAALNLERAVAQREESRTRTARYIQDLADRDRKQQLELQDREYKQGLDKLDQSNKDRAYELELRKFAANGGKLTESELNDLAEFNRLQAQDGKTPEDIALESAANDPEGIFRYMTDSDANMIRGKIPPPVAPQNLNQLSEDDPARKQYEKSVSDYNEARQRAEKAKLTAQEKLIEEKRRGANSNAGTYRTVFKNARRGVATASPQPQAGGKRVIDASRYQLP